MHRTQRAPAAHSLPFYWKIGSPKKGWLFLVRIAEADFRFYPGLEPTAGAVSGRQENPKLR
jgi:hypothetical protein